MHPCSSLNPAPHCPCPCAPVSPPSLLQLLLNTVALRRSKEQEVNGRRLVQLPPKAVHLVRVRLSREERLKYERWEDAGG